MIGCSRGSGATVEANALVPAAVFIQVVESTVAHLARNRDLRLAVGKATGLWCERNVGGVRHYTLVKKPKRCVDFAITRDVSGGRADLLKKVRYKSKWGKKTVRATATVKLSSGPRFRAAVRFTAKKKLGPCHSIQTRFDKTYTRIWVRFPKGQESQMTGKRWQLIATPIVACH